MKKSILLLASIVLLAASCEKDGPLDTGKLPPATMSGKNTFGCKINGEVWLPGGGTIWDGPIYAKHDMGWVGCDQLFVPASHIFDDGETSIYQSISINVWCPKLGENIMTFNKGAYKDFKGCGEYYLDTLSTYKLNITRLDSVKFIASGTFEFTAINDDFKDTLVITEGRFDVDTHL